MKRFIATCGLLLASFFAGALWIGIPVGAGGQNGAGERPSTGDTNGDSVVDMSDAVYLLTYLFQGGPAPVACAQDADLVERVEAVEEAVGAVAGEVGGVGEGLVLLAEAIQEMNNPCKDRYDRFIENDDGTVTDTCTELMWLETADQPYLSFDDALARVESIDVGGYTDWRFPTTKEWESIFHMASGSVLLSDVMVEPVFRIGGSGHEYWALNRVGGAGWIVRPYFDVCRGTTPSTTACGVFSPNASIPARILAVRNAE